jgi:hypothetical protein
MLLQLLASAVVAASSAPDPASPPASPAGSATTPAPAPSSSPQPFAPASQTPSIDSLLKRQNAEQSTDTEDDSGASQPQGPIPYSQFDAKAYDSALANAAAAARASAGPLDGGWTVAATDGHRMYRLQFLDHGYGYSQAEGAWRDLDGGPRLKGSGFVDQVNYSTDQLTLRFHESDPGDEVLITVKPSRSGAWEGQLLRHGAWTQVTFRRD